jgi:hypothetical protein
VRSHLPRKCHSSIGHFSVVIPAPRSGHAGPATRSDGNPSFSHRDHRQMDFRLRGNDDVKFHVRFFYERGRHQKFGSNIASNFKEIRI